ncbi:MAG: hypothetical protein ACE5DU_01510 [Nitrosopumilus sp.]
MLIICKGFRQNQKHEKCNFCHNGNWGDSALVDHQKYHKSLETENYSWLGFDLSQSIGQLSGRDGKRM